MNIAVYATLAGVALWGLFGSSVARVAAVLPFCAYVAGGASLMG